LILVTVGTHNIGFDRLVKAMDELSAGLEEPVLIQYGSSTYVPDHAEHFQWATSERMQELIGQARVVISHAAAGSIISVLKAGKPLVVVPRSKKHGEVVDDHQFQLTRALVESGKGTAVVDPFPSVLQDAINAAVKLSPIQESAASLIAALNEQLGIWEARP
jgi:beta-1,4-N-acetylglucosaminyltransferase